MIKALVILVHIANGQPIMTTGEKIFKDRSECLRFQKELHFIPTNYPLIIKDIYCGKHKNY